MTKLKAFVLPPRDLFDVVAMNDISHLAVALGHSQPQSVQDKEAATAPMPAAPVLSPSTTPAVVPQQVTTYRDAFGFSALHVAAAHGHLQLCELLLEAGADAGAATDLGHTPLHAAAEYGSEEIAAALLERGADPAATTSSFVTPLQLARRCHHGALAVMLEPRTRERVSAAATPTEAASQGDLLYFVQAVEDGKVASLRRAGDNGETCLTAICSLEVMNAERHVRGVMRFLLEHGIVNPNESNADGLTPLMAAARNGHVEAAKLLVAHGADATLAHGDGKGGSLQTPAQLACDRHTKLFLKAASAKQEFEDLHARRNDIPFDERPTFVRDVKAARVAMRATEAELRSFEGEIGMART